MKKILSLFLAYLLLFSVAVFVADAADEMIIIESKPISVTYNGNDIHFPDALPLIQNGRTLVPVRAIMERAKLTVDYDSTTRTVTASKNDLTIVMVIDSADATITRGDAVQQVTLEEPARLIDGRTYVPIRFLSESMDVKVNWNANGREVVLIDSAEWKDKIAQKAPLLNSVLNLPLQQKPYFMDSAGDAQIELILKNMPSTTETSRSEIKSNFDLSFSQTEVFDGTNTGAYLVLQADLSSLKKLPTSLLGADDTTLQKLAKMHRIDVDMVLDKDANFYIKSVPLVEKMREIGITDLADTIGNRYVKLVDTSQKDEDTKNADTLWEYIVNTIESDDLLYSQSVAHISQIVDSYIATFGSNRCSTKTLAKGVTRHECTLTEKELTFLNFIKPEASGITDSDIDLKMFVTESNGVATKMEFNLSFVSAAKPLDSIEGAKNPTAQYKITFNVGMAFRDYSSTYDRNVSIPKNIITLEELEKKFENSITS